MTPIEISAIVFSCVFGGALLGIFLRPLLPAQHLSADTRDVIKLGVGLVGTMAALVLGLLVASAKGSFDARSNELTQLAANTILLDRVLAHYGPESGEMRGMLKAAMARMIDQTWSKQGSTSGSDTPAVGGEPLFDKIEELGPRTDAQRALQAQAQSIAINLGQTRWLLFEQSGTSISRPFLVVVVFWLSILFVGFGLLGPRNWTLVITLLVSAMSVAGALFLILELDIPFSGLIQISSEPLRKALALLGS
jgi:hypothetical protein